VFTWDQPEPGGRLRLELSLRLPGRCQSESRK